MVGGMSGVGKSSLIDVFTKKPSLAEVVQEFKEKRLPPREEGVKGKMGEVYFDYAGTVIK